jgi:DNA topoisomerase-1
MLEAEEASRISLKTVLEPVAEALGNTMAISRKSYVHPKLIEAARDRPRSPLNGMERPRGRKWLTSEEIGLLDFLAGRKRKPKSAEAVEKTADAAVRAAARGPAKVRKAAEEASATA